MKNNVDKGVMDATFKTYGYETETKYFGLHAGIGRSVPVGEHSVLDVYGKYFHTYTERDSWELATGDPYELDGIKSDRIRAGGRVTTDRGGAYRYYCGLAYEYEFSGDAHLKASGAPVDADGLRGGTGILELGVNFKESHDSPWSLDFNVKGYAGVREGVSAQLQAVYGF